MFPVIAAIPCMLGVATKYCQILYFATCFCFVLALLLLALSFSFLIALLTNFSSGVSNALKALDRAFLTFCLRASLLRTAGKQNKMLLRRLPGPRKRVGERVHTYAHARTKTISRPKYIYIANSLESQLRSLRSLR